MSSAQSLILKANRINKSGDHRAAIPLYEEAIAADPRRFDAWCNKGIALAAMQQFADAEQCFRKALALGDGVNTLFNLGNMYSNLVQLELAERCYRQILAIDAGNAEAETNLGRLLLGRGEWAEGFKHYHARWQTVPDDEIPDSRAKYPHWNGEPGCVILYPEQGFGDEIMCMRFAGVLAGLGHPFRLEKRAPMKRLAEFTYGSLESDLPPEYACSSMDVPMVLGITPDLMPLRERYLLPPPAPPRPALEHRLKIGICWTSGYRPKQRATIADWQAKSIPLFQLEPLIKAAPGAEWLSLQKGVYEPKMEEFGIRPMDDVADFADTAAIIAGLDLTITVDTSVAHLAGALGKPVWNFVRFAGLWPWRRETEGTCWYESMMLYRQPRLNDWKTPIERAAADLSALRL